MRISSISSINFNGYYKGVYYKDSVIKLAEKYKYISNCDSAIKSDIGKFYPRKKFIQADKDADFANVKKIMKDKEDDFLEKDEALDVLYRRDLQIKTEIEESKKGKKN